MMLWLALFFPVIGGLLDYFVSFRKKKHYAWLAVLSLFLSLLVLFFNIPLIVSSGSILEQYSWIPSLDIGFNLGVF